MDDKQSEPSEASPGPDSLTSSDELARLEQLLAMLAQGYVELASMVEAVVDSLPVATKHAVVEDAKGRMLVMLGKVEQVRREIITHKTTPDD